MHLRAEMKASLSVFGNLLLDGKSATCGARISSGGSQPTYHSSRTRGFVQPPEEADEAESEETSGDSTTSDAGLPDTDLTWERARSVEARTNRTCIFTIIVNPPSWMVQMIGSGCWGREQVPWI